MWLDADAIILDLGATFFVLFSCIMCAGFEIEAVGEQFPKAELIASADIRMGYINR